MAVGGTLSLSRVTLTGGKTRVVSGENGGAITVRGSAADSGGGTLNLSDAAIVGNVVSTGDGGGIYFYPRAGGTISNSVITSNDALDPPGFTGGVFLAFAAGVNSPQVVVTDTIIAKNTAYQASGKDVLAQTGRSFTSGGNNRLTSGGTGFGVSGDYINAAVDYVVTGIADTFDHTDDAVVTSVRDAIDLANTTASAQEIWLPAWKFVLTRERIAASTSVEMDISQGDLDIADSLTIRGVEGVTSVAWRAGAAPDKVFELLGDYNSNMTVDSADYIVWRKQSGLTGPGLAADGDDNGIVDSADYNVYTSHFGNTLTLINLLA